MRSAAVETVRKLEKACIAGGTGEFTLMRRAGVRAAAWISAKFPRAGRFVILCGGGNNGGDALVAAAELSKKFPVVIYSTRARDEFRNCAATAAADLPPEIPFFVRQKLDENDFFSGDVIVDGLLGIGFTGGALRDEVKSFIAAANRSRLPVAALDLPSGIDGDSGNASPDGAVTAALTLTFGVPKNGLFASDGIGKRGMVRCIDIGLPANDAPGVEIMTNCDAVKMMPDFAPEDHKNSRGRVLVWGGSVEYPGAAALAVCGAMCSGAGLVRCVSEVLPDLPRAAIYRRLGALETPESWYDLSDVLVCGCGWGSSGNAAKLSAAWEFPGTLIVDADALNVLARHPGVWKKRENLILTPHPGEAARLAESAGVTLSGNRMENARLLAEKFHATVIYKGKDSIVAAPGREPRVIAAGSPALATAGCGDVLAGCVGALAARRGVDAFTAAVLGAYLHGVAGENAPGVLIADQLPEQIGLSLRKIVSNGLF